jgi:hypothetical protein
MKDYKVVNEIINNMWIKAQLDNFLIDMLKGKKIEIHQKMIMIWTFKNKVHFKTFESP